MANKLKKMINAFFKSLFTKWLEDIFVFIGVVLIIFTTYQYFGHMVGNFALGFVLLIFGFLIAKKD